MEDNRNLPTSHDLECGRMKPLLDEGWWFSCVVYMCKEVNGERKYSKLADSLSGTLIWRGQIATMEMNGNDLKKRLIVSCKNYERMVDSGELEILAKEHAMKRVEKRIRESLEKKLRMTVEKDIKICHK